MKDYLITIVKPNEGYAGPETVKTIRLIQVTGIYLDIFLDGVRACYPKYYNIYSNEL